MKSIIFGLTLSCWLIVAFSFAQAEDIKPGTVVRACGDGAGWPPYTYFKRINGQKTEKVIGYDVDVLRMIGEKNGIKFSVAMPPWKRCTKQTRKGKHFQIAVSASYSKERAKKYLMTRYYYTTAAHYFYSRKNKPMGLSIQNTEDLIKFKICGLHGYNYEGFGISNKIVDRGSQTFPAVIKKTHQGKCDLFLEKYEIIAGFTLVGEDYLDKDIGHAPVPGTPPDKFYMLISRKYKHARILKSILDKGIAELERTGRLRKILSRHLR